jgi:nucleotide-binding universal stress UspA family protein
MMGELIALIPLDGTKLSENSYSMLPFVRKLGIERVRLVSVWESAWEVTETGRERSELEDVTEKGRNYVNAYLEQQAATVRAQGFEVEPIARVGRPAEAVLGATDDVDLIVIATHGRAGVVRWWLGSVADEIVKESTCPTLVIGPNVAIALEPYELERVLLPLDGSEMAEQAIPLAALIARATGAEIDVVRCMSLTSVAYDPGMGMYSAELIDSMEESVRAYLEGVASRIEGAKVTTTMMTGAPSEMLLEHLRERPAGLVVTTSHGRRGVARAALGSVTDRLLHGPAPVLIYRPREGAGGDLVDAARVATGL